MRTETGGGYEGVIHKCLRRWEIRLIDMTMLAMLLLIILYVICDLLMMLIVYWRIFALIRLTVDQVE